MLPSASSGRRIRLSVAVTRDVLNSGPCTYCGEASFRLTVDHVVPVSKGGTNDRANLTPACWPCNKEKLDFTPDEWRAWREEMGYPWPPQSKSAFAGEVFQRYRSQWLAEKAVEEATALAAQHTEVSGYFRRLRAAADELAAADQAMVALSNRDKAAGVRDETPEFYAANDRIDAALDRLPWVLRGWASWRSGQRLDWSAS